MIRFQLCTFGRYTNDFCLLGSLYDRILILVSFKIGDVSCGHLIRVISARFHYYKVIFPFVVNK
jgi:hypothetical protein